MTKNEYIDLHDNTDDFGFTTVSETDIITPVSDESTDLKKRLQAIRKIFMPLLENLAKNPQQELIKWPNRGAVLKKQMETLKKLTEVDLS